MPKLTENNARLCPGITPSSIKFSSLSGSAQLCPSRNVVELPPELCIWPPTPPILAREFKNSCNNNTGALPPQSLPAAEIEQRVHSQARDHGGLQASLLPSVPPGSKDEDAQTSLVIVPRPRGTRGCLARVTQGQEPRLAGDEGFTSWDGAVPVLPWHRWAQPRGTADLAALSFFLGPSPSVQVVAGIFLHAR